MRGGGHKPPQADIVLYGKTAFAECTPGGYGL
jgi:hypothetical protein